MEIGGYHANYHDLALAHFTVLAITRTITILFSSVDQLRITIISPGLGNYHAIIHDFLGPRRESRRPTTLGITIRFDPR